MKLFPVKLLSNNTNFDFMGKRKITFTLTIILIITSFFMLFNRGLNYGIDFTGGMLIEVRSTNNFNLAEVRNSLNNLKIGEISLQNLGTEQDLLIKVGGKTSLDTEQTIEVIKQNLAKINNDIEYRRIDYVGPQVGKELIENGIYASIISFLAIMIYIWFRFEWQYSLGLILALLHDVIVTIGFLSVTYLEFNLASIAAILTIVGYSVNDSVVIFDRIRENLAIGRKKDIFEIINMSLNQTLSRTILTISTTLLATICLILFAGKTVESFSFVIFAGILIGTYSSVYISAPVLIYFKLGKKTP
jgi:preprotein translocase subunit SecF